MTHIYVAYTYFKEKQFWIVWPRILRYKITCICTECYLCDWGCHPRWACPASEAAWAAAGRPRAPAPTRPLGHIHTPVIYNPTKLSFMRLVLHLFQITTTKLCCVNSELMALSWMGVICSLTASHKWWALSYMIWSNFYTLNTPFLFMDRTKLTIYTAQFCDSDLIQMQN